MDDYESQRQRHLADALALSSGLIGRLDWPAERLAVERDDRLRALVRVAVERSPWHRKRLGKVDLDGLSEASLQELPVMTRDDLMDNFDDVVTDDRLSLDLVNGHLERLPEAGYLLDGYTAIASGGSTGRRGVFVFGWEEWAIFYIGLHRYLLRSIATDPDLRPGSAVMANVAAGHPTHPTAAFNRTFSGPHLTMVKLPVTLPVDEIVAGLNETQPTFLGGYASSLHQLTFEACAGRLRIAPKRILSYAEPLFPEIRSALEGTWGVPVGNWWGAAEGGPLGVPCDSAATHLSEDLLIVEPVDAQGSPVPPGECSTKVYLTNLYNRSMPLIRYEITDQVSMIEEPCPCGSAHRRVADIQGRLDDTFVYRALSVHPHVFRSPLGQRTHIIEYQVRQTAAGADIAVRSTGPVDLHTLGREIEQGLTRIGLTEPVVSVTAVDRLERGTTGKLKRFIPLGSATALSGIGA